MRAVLSALSAATLLLSLPCSAQEAAQESAQETRTRSYEFEEPIEGELEQPDGALITPLPGIPSPREVPADLDLRLARAEGLPRAAQIRLAELLVARSMGNQVRAYDLQDRAFNARGTSSYDEIMRRGQAFEARYRADAEAAIGLLRRSLAQLPDPLPPAEARALWLLSLLEAEHRQPQRAQASARRLIRACPRCEQAADALILLADSAFAEASLELAMDLYRQVLAHPAARSELVGYAQYKLAWCAINLQRYPDAFVAFSAARAAARGPRGHGLRRKAARDQLRALSMLGLAPREQLRILRGLSPDAGAKEEVLERYLRLLTDQGRESEAEALRARRDAIRSPR